MNENKKQKHIRGGCPHCPGNRDVLKMNTKIIAGFGDVTITRNKKLIYSEPPQIEWEDAPTLMKFENMARKQGGVWRYALNLPLRSGIWERKGKNNWVLIKSGIGFA